MVLGYPHEYITMIDKAQWWSAPLKIRKILIKLIFFKFILHKIAKNAALMLYAYPQYADYSERRWSWKKRK